MSARRTRSSGTAGRPGRSRPPSRTALDIGPRCGERPHRRRIEFREDPMTLKALSSDYEQHIEYRDAERNFHGNRVVYLHWEEHLSFCAALAFPLPPDMPFAAFIDAIVKGHYNAHPD